jgi:hypothetical protein
MRAPSLDPLIADETMYLCLVNRISRRRLYIKLQ